MSELMDAAVSKSGPVHHNGTEETNIKNTRHTHLHKQKKCKTTPGALHTRNAPEAWTQNPLDFQRGGDIRICKKDFAAGQRVLMMNPFIIE